MLKDLYSRLFRIYWAAALACFFLFACAPTQTELPEPTITEGSIDRLAGPILDKEIIADISWSDDGKRLAAVSRKGTVLIWNSLSKAYQKTGLLDDDSSYRWAEIHWRPSTEAFSIQTDKRVVVWDADRRSPLMHVPESYGVESAIWTPDGERLVVAAGDGNSSLYRLLPETNSVISDRLPSLMIFRFVGWFDERTVLGMNVELKLVAYTFAGLGSSLSFWPLENLFPGTTRFVEEARAQVIPRSELIPLLKQEFKFSLSPDSQRLAVFIPASLAAEGPKFGIADLEAKDGSVLFLDVATYGGDANSISWSYDGSMIAAAMVNGTVAIFDSERGDVHAEISNVGQDQNPRAVRWSPTESTLAIGSAGVVYLWSSQES